MTANRDSLVAGTSLLGAIASLLTVSAGCGTPTDQGGPPRGFIRIQSSVSDGSTNVGQGPFPVSFYGAGRLLDAHTMAELLARLELSAWPEGTPISATATLDPTSNDNMALGDLSVVTPLANRWYALRFGPPQSGLVSQQTFDGDIWGVRLRPDSHPGVSLVQFCVATNPSGMKFIVKFSEKVTIDQPAAALTVRQNGSAMTCRLDGLDAGEVHQFCPELTAAPVTVALAAEAVHGLDGTFLASASWTVDVAKLPVVETGCNGYRVPL